MRWGPGPVFVYECRDQCTPLAELRRPVIRRGGTARWHGHDRVVRRSVYAREFGSTIRMARRVLLLRADRCGHSVS